MEGGVYDKRGTAPHERNTHSRAVVCMHCSFRCCGLQGGWDRGSPAAPSHAARRCTLTGRSTDLRPQARLKKMLVCTIPGKSCPHRALGRRRGSSESVRLPAAAVQQAVQALRATVQSALQLMSGPLNEELPRVYLNSKVKSVHYLQASLALSECARELPADISARHRRRHPAQDSPLRFRNHKHPRLHTTGPLCEWWRAGACMQLGKTLAGTVTEVLLAAFPSEVSPSRVQPRGQLPRCCNTCG